MRTRVVSILSRVALVLLLGLVAVVAPPATAQGCVPAVPPGTYRGSMDAVLTVRGVIPTPDFSGPLDVEFRQNSEELTIFVECNGSVSGTTSLLFTLDLAVDGTSPDDTSTSVGLTGSGLIRAEILGSVEPGPGGLPVFVLSLIPVAGSGSMSLLTDVTAPRRNITVDVKITFDIRDLEDLLGGEPIPMMLRARSATDGTIVGDIFDPSELAGLGNGGLPPELQVAASGSWRLQRIEGK